LFEVDRPQRGERAVLVQLDSRNAGNEESLAEFRELALSAGAKPVATVIGGYRKPDSKLFVGKGKAEEVQLCVQQEQAEVVLINHTLTPAQERNLERTVNCRVLDRTALILDIFAQRARSFEGKLQVELAQLKHLSSRLVRGWTHLERQKGGIGLRGPGESQLETDRRLIGQRIKLLNKRLEKTHKQRQLQRRSRRRMDVPVISLVGYTNAGKSTLFNRLTGASVFAADQLFATLDPTLRRVKTANGQTAVLADTVGFISQLPHGLVAAFSATLEETRDAQLLLHVVDCHSEQRHESIDQVNKVLAQIDAEGVPQIEVYNKIDLLDGGQPRVERDQQGRVRRIWVSAVTGAGVDLLRDALFEYLADMGGGDVEAQGYVSLDH